MLTEINKNLTLVTADEVLVSCVEIKTEEVNYEESGWLLGD